MGCERLRGTVGKARVTILELRRFDIPFVISQPGRLSTVELGGEIHQFLCSQEYYFVGTRTAMTSSRSLRVVLTLLAVHSTISAVVAGKTKNTIVLAISEAKFVERAFRVAPASCAASIVCSVFPRPGIVAAGIACRY